VVVEGVARSLDPHINIWEAARPVVERYIRENLGPDTALRDVVRAMRVLSRFGPKLPQLAEAALTRQGGEDDPPPRRGKAALAAAGYVLLGAAAAIAGVVAYGVV